MSESVQTFTDWSVGYREMSMGHFIIIKMLGPCMDPTRENFRLYQWNFSELSWHLYALISSELFTDMKKCNFCNNNSAGDKLVLKLKPSMLETLGIRSSSKYYACKDHFDCDAFKEGKCHRWAQEAKINVNCVI